MWFFKTVVAAATTTAVSIAVRNNIIAWEQRTGKKFGQFM